MSNDPVPSNLDHDSSLRREICQWLRDNGIDPALVPDWERPSCTYRGEGSHPFGGHTITTRIHIRSAPDSNAITIGHLADRPAETTITRRMQVAPSAAVQSWLNSRCPECGR